ncbi:hypothetical protein [Paenibacillus sp. MBLB4367]|uniref:hypothetical protein n=1 Tax=Paenibacillus sp. MBLB4367 TaxID=3384767 RepID=UPI003907EFC0
MEKSDPTGAIDKCGNGRLSSAEDAFRAAFDILRFIGPFQDNLPAEDRIDDKIGHQLGTAIVVNTAGVLDYFGCTVNIAVRIRGTSSEEMPS